MATPIRTSTSNGQDGARRRPRRSVFDKDQATLLLLTVTLGLGLGAVIRIVQRSDQASASASQRTALQQTVPQTGTIYGGTSYGTTSQPAYVLPQRTYGARGTTRMS